MNKTDEKLRTIIQDLIEKQRSFAFNGKVKRAPLIVEELLAHPEIKSDKRIETLLREAGAYKFVIGSIKKKREIDLGNQSREAMLEQYNVPPEERAIIMALNRDRVRCPSAGGYVDLYGPSQGTPEQLDEAADTLEPQVRAYKREQDLLRKLAKLRRLTAETRIRRR